MDADRARELLTRERIRVEQTLARLAPDRSDELADYDQHPADEGTELFEEERDEGIADKLQEELAAIERAERRVDEGTYGVSIESGRPIPDARLEAIPWAERTEEEEERAP
jgi:RNA polymerase-binding transcription factor DksA